MVQIISAPVSVWREVKGPDAVTNGPADNAKKAPCRVAHNYRLHKNGNPENARVGQARMTSRPIRATETVENRIPVAAEASIGTELLLAAS